VLKIIWVCSLYLRELGSRILWNSELKIFEVYFWIFIVFLKDIQTFKKEIFERERVWSEKKERECKGVCKRGIYPTGQFLELCKCSLRNLGESPFGSPIPLGASPFGQIGHRIGPPIGEDTRNFGEISPGRRIHSASPNVHPDRLVALSDWRVWRVNLQVGELNFMLGEENSAFGDWKLILWPFLLRS